MSPSRRRGPTRGSAKGSGMNSEAEMQDLGELRTQWADEHTRMAGERIFAAWLRTGLALTAAGLASVLISV